MPSTPNWDRRRRVLSSVGRMHGLEEGCAEEAAALIVWLERINYEKEQESADQALQEVEANEAMEGGEEEC